DGRLMTPGRKSGTKLLGGSTHEGVARDDRNLHPPTLQIAFELHRGQQARTATHTGGSPVWAPSETPLRDCFVWRTNIANRKLVGDGDCAPWTGEIKAERMSAGALFGVRTGFRDRPMPTPS